ncbi:uncharacterized protein LOC119905019 isoform X3 [Micropterus salmoides]|nr:uncharacterized protein LOC119905019 isoform X3 [Micropterus salmoides]
MDGPSSPDPYREFEIFVSDVPTTLKPTSTLPVFLTSDPSVSTPTQISQTDQQQTGTASPRGWISFTTVLLYVFSIPFIIVFLSGLTLMIICIQRNTKPKGLQTRGNSDGTNMEVTFFNSLITLTVG